MLFRTRCSLQTQLQTQSQLQTQTAADVSVSETVGKARRLLLGGQKQTRVHKDAGSQSTTTTTLRSTMSSRFSDKGAPAPQYEAEVAGELTPTRTGDTKYSDSADDKYVGGLDPLEDSSRDAAIKRRIDWRLLPPLAILYAFSLIDRTNIGNARIEGMNAELKLNVGERYSIALLVFFPTYALFEIPGTLLFRRCRPRYFIGVIGVAWGAVTLGMGFSKNWQTLTALRAVLGALEASYFPGAVYLIAQYYCRGELQKRMSLFYGAGVAASGVSSIMAYGLARIGPRYGLNPWRWIYLCQGAITVALAILCAFTVVDFPTSRRNRFLSERDHARMLYRIEKDRADVEVDTVTVRKVCSYLLEWKIWLFSLMFMCCTVTSYALSFFLPTLLLLKLRFKLVEAQCLAAPPYIFAIILAMTSAYFSDRIKRRIPFMILHSTLCIIGLALLYAPRGVPAAVQYFGVFLVASGTNANIPFVLTLAQNNIHTSSRKATYAAMTVSGGAVGGVFGSLVFYAKSAPAYRPGMLACICCNLFIISAAIFLNFLFERRNKRQEQGEVLEGKPGFRYVL